MFRREQARIAELRRCQLEGLLISRDQVLRQWQAHISEAKQELASLPDTIALRCPEGMRKSVRREIETVLDRICRILSRWTAEKEIASTDRRSRVR